MHYRSWREWGQDVPNVQVRGDETSGNWKVKNIIAVDFVILFFEEVVTMEVGGLQYSRKTKNKENF